MPCRRFSRRHTRRRLSNLDVERSLFRKIQALAFVTEGTFIVNQCRQLYHERDLDNGALSSLLMTDFLLPTK